MELESTAFHFPIMILASLGFFFLIIRMIIGRQAYREKFRAIVILSIIVVVLGMVIGKYGAQMGFPWWIYYPVPMLMTVILPPLVLRLNRRNTIYYLIFSFLSAPLIHVLFSFFLGWTEYMPFWDVPFAGDL